MIDTTNFNLMQKMESEVGFEEGVLNKKSGKKIKFFNLGSNNDWKNSLDVDLKNQIEKKL